MKTIYSRRITVLVAVLLLAGLTACSSCQKDEHPSEPKTDAQQAADTSTDPADTIGQEEQTAGSQSEETTYNDYGEWDIPQNTP